MAADEVAGEGGGVDRLNLAGRKPRSYAELFQFRCLILTDAWGAHGKIPDSSIKHLPFLLLKGRRARTIQGDLSALMLARHL